MDLHLDGGFMVFHSSRHFGECSPVVNHGEGSQKNFGQPGTKVSGITVFNPLATQRCVLH